MVPYPASMEKVHWSMAAADWWNSVVNKITHSVCLTPTVLTLKLHVNCCKWSMAKLGCCWRLLQRLRCFWRLLKRVWCCWRLIQRLKCCWRLTHRLRCCSRLLQRSLCCFQLVHSWPICLPAIRLIPHMGVTRPHPNLSAHRWMGAGGGRGRRREKKSRNSNLLNGPRKHMLYFSWPKLGSLALKRWG